MDERQNWYRPELSADLLDRLAEIGDLLYLVRDFRYSLRGLGDPAPESPAMRDRLAMESTFGTPDPALRVYFLVDLWLMEASHHLAAIGTLYKSGDVLFGPLPLTRIVLELSARVAYLLAPAITTQQRAARATIEEAHSIQHMATAEKRLNGEESKTYEGLRLRVSDLRDEALRVFGPGAEGDPSQWDLVGQTLVRPSEAVKRFGAIQDRGRTFLGIYDRLSTHTHPSMGSTLFLDRDDRGRITGLTMRRDVLETVAQNSLAFFHVALKHFAEYSRWEPGTLDQLNGEIERTFPSFFAD